MNELTPVQALAILINATEPQNIVRLSRANFVEIERALITLNEFINVKSAKTEKFVEQVKEEEKVRKIKAV